MNAKVDLVEIEKFYNEHEVIWYNNWYRYTNKSIDLFLKKNCTFTNDEIILNAGSGGILTVYQDTQSIWILLKKH